MALITFKDLPDTTTPVNAANLNNNFTEMFNLIYPVGSIYMSMNSTNPGTLFGGTWEQLKARFLCGVGTLDTTNSSTFYGNTPSAYTVFENETGGENFHSLTVNELAEHNHSLGIAGGSSETPMANFEYTYNTEHRYYAGQDLIGNTGAGWGHNNMPPYFAVYMWKRTA